MEALILIFIAGLAEGVMDMLQFHFYLNHKFWNPKLSWVNKWKGGRPEHGERFFLSSTLLVAFTDGWHLMKLIRNVFIFASMFFIPSCEPLYLILFIIAMRAAYGLGFTITYKYL